MAFKTIQQNTKKSKRGIEISLEGLSWQDSMRVQGAPEWYIWALYIGQIYLIPITAIIMLYQLIKKLF